MVLDVIRRIVPSKYRPYRVLCNLAWASSEGCVVGGPFRGLHYVSQAVNSALVPKLLGIYERELIPAIECVIASGPARIVDIGSAEGYYAVGLARRCPRASVIAFDRDVRARQLVSDMARMNDVADRVTVRGACTQADLAVALDNSASVIICDVEGFEVELLDPERVPSLRKATILVEVHDDLVPRAGEILHQRFEATHRITRVAAEPRRASDCPCYHPLVRFAPPSTRVSLIVERPDFAAMYWFLLEPSFLAAS